MSSCASISFRIAFINSSRSGCFIASCKYMVSGSDEAFMANKSSLGTGNMAGREKISHCASVAFVDPGSASAASSGGVGEPCGSASEAPSGGCIRLNSTGGGEVFGSVLS